MKAIICPKYGPPDVLQLREVATPEPKDDEVRIKISATTVNSGDVRIRGFKAPAIAWLPMRLMVGLTGPRQPILGLTFAGEIEAVGKDVQCFEKGDQVFGSSGFAMGAHAEYTCLPEKGVLALKPSNLSYEEAACIPFGGNSALVFLRRGKIQSGQKVLVYGASGAVGTAAIQLAKHFGAEVTGVCSTANVRLIESLGADHVIDYTQTALEDYEDRYDLVFDAVGKISKSKCKHLLTPQGTFVSVNSMKVAQETTDNLVFLRELAEAGVLKPVVDRRYGMEQAAEAHRYVDAGHKRGNVVLTM